MNESNYYSNNDSEPLNQFLYEPCEEFKESELINNKHLEDKKKIRSNSIRRHKPRIVIRKSSRFL